MRLVNDQKILIVGLGLIGGSYAMGLSKLGFEVGAITLDEESINYGIEHQIIRHGQTCVTKDYLDQFDLIIFALYPHVFIEWIKEYGKLLKPGLLITDVTGVKGEVVMKIKEMLPSGVEFIAAHPMAGKEVYGIKNADNKIFLGANLIITPTDDNTNEAIEVIKELGKLLQFKNIAILTIAEHDEMIGFLSQLTHCIAVSLMTCKESSHLVEYTGDSFRDLTRIAKINEDMWTELFLMNKKALLKQMDLFLDQFIKLKKAIETENISEMKEMMRLSTLRRKYFDK